MGKIYAVMAFVGGLILAFLKIFSMGKTSATNEIKAQSMEDKMEYEKAGREAADTGRINEEKVKNEDNKPDTTRYFD